MKIQLTCDNCGSTFERESRESKRSEKLGRKQYCSRKCAGKVLLSNIPPDKRHSGFEPHHRWTGDEMSQFRVHLRRARKRFQEMDITLEYLKEVWETQDGICPYSGVKLIKPSYKKKNDPKTTASLDRIDSSKGYIKGNIQFISMAINYMKNVMSHEETMEMCKLIAKNY